MRNTIIKVSFRVGALIAIWGWATAASGHNLDHIPDPNAKAATHNPAHAPDSGVVNINEASEQQLTLLPRIGPSTAKRIIAYRKRRPFRRTRELKRVRGIGKRTLRLLLPHIVVQGPTTLTQKVKVRPRTS